MVLIVSKIKNTIFRQKYMGFVSADRALLVQEIYLQEYPQGGSLQLIELAIVEIFWTLPTSLYLFWHDVVVVAESVSILTPSPNHCDAPKQSG